MTGVARVRPGEPVGPLRACLARGGLLALPTESSYGLAADPRNLRALEAIYRLKGRDAAKALPLVAASVEQIVALGVDPAAPELAALAPLWPAPLSVVLPLAPGAELPAAAPDRTVAVRIPAHPTLVALLLGLGGAVTATSANRSGEPPVTTPDAAARLLAGMDAVVVDAGELAGGPPSTLVRLRRGRNAGSKGGPWEVLRAGAFPAERLPETVARGRDEDLTQ